MGLSSFPIEKLMYLFTFLIINQLEAVISQIYFGLKLYMFRTVPLSIIRNSSLYTQQWYMSYRFADSLLAGAYAHARKLSADLYDIYHGCVYSEKILMMDRGTVRNI